MAAFNARKRTLRDIWPHLVMSACALLLPPLGMAAGVVYLGSSHPHESAMSATATAPIAVAAEPTRQADPPPALASTAVAGTATANTAAANTLPSAAEQRTAPQPQVAAASAPALAAAATPTSTKDANAKDAAAKNTAAKEVPAPSAAQPSVANIGESSEQTARAEAAAPTENADAPATAANAQQAGQKQRHDSRGGRVRQARIPSITDIFGVHRYR